MRMRSYVLLWLLLCLAHVAAAQFQLVVEKPGAFKRHRIQVGDLVAIRVKGMDQFYAGELEGVKADKLYIFGDSLSPDSIDALRIGRPRGFTNMLRGSIIMSAVLAPLLFIVNPLPRLVSLETVGWVAGYSASALLLQKGLKHFYWDRVNLRSGRWRLRIMPTAESLVR